MKNKFSDNLNFCHKEQNIYYKINNFTFSPQFRTFFTRIIFICSVCQTGYLAHCGGQCLFQMNTIFIMRLINNLTSFLQYNKHFDNALTINVLIVTTFTNISFHTYTFNQMVCQQNLSNNFYSMS